MTTTSLHLPIIHWRVARRRPEAPLPAAAMALAQSLASAAQFRAAAHQNRLASFGWNVFASPAVSAAAVRR